MLDPQSVPLLYLFEKDIDALGAVYPLLSGYKTTLIPIFDVQSLVAILDVTLELLVDGHFPSLASLLLEDYELVTIQEHRPSELFQV